MKYRPVSDEELAVAIVYAREEYGVHCIDQDMLRKLANRTIEQYHLTPRAGFVFIAAKVIRGEIRSKTKQEDQKVQAFKGALAKIGNLRAQRKKQLQTPTATAVSMSRQRYPEDPKRANQFMLL